MDEMMDEMRIAGQYTVRDYEQLNLNEKEDWEKAIEIFKMRMKTRFINPIKEIENKKYAGFAIMAICCLLIETLKQFYEGNEESSISKEAFKGFLAEDSLFATYFDHEEAKVFYEKIRCGILHQAKIKDSCLIRNNNTLMESIEGSDGLIIDARKFSNKLIEEFEAYIEKLKEKEDRELIYNFKRKMRFICGG